MIANAVRAQLEKIVGDYSGWHWLHTALYAPFKPDPWERYGKIKAPTLIVTGERDLPACHSVARSMAVGIPGARSHVIPRAGTRTLYSRRRSHLDSAIGIAGWLP